MFEALALAKERAMACPSPEPAPVITMFLPVWERSGLLGSIAEYDEVWYLSTGDGKEAI